MNQAEQKIKELTGVSMQEHCGITGTWESLQDYISIARPDHWFKNVFMVPGLILGWLVAPATAYTTTFVNVLLAIGATCLVCSSNYTINEWLDAHEDRKHPEKKLRPAAAGRIQPFWAYAQWALLAAVGLILAWQIGLPFFMAELSLFIMGILYNVKPFRSKERPYIDVLSESINNPIRLLLGWFCVCSFAPPASLLVSYWMIGAYFMAIKRYAELRHINDCSVAASYRKSFAYYTQERLLISIMFYATCFALFMGIFLIRYRVELILSIPFIAGFMAFYLYLGFLDNSPTQHPESLHKQKRFLLYTCLTAVIIVVCCVIRLPLLNSIFDSTVPHFMQ